MVRRPRSFPRRGRLCRSARCARARAHREWRPRRARPDRCAARACARPRSASRCLTSAYQSREPQRRLATKNTKIFFQSTKFHQEQNKNILCVLCGYRLCGYSSSWLLVRDRRKARAFTKQPIDARAMRLLIRLRRHPCSERLQLLVRFDGELLERLFVRALPQPVDQQRVDLMQAIDQRITRVAANRLRLRARGIQLANDVVENRIQRTIRAATKRRQPRDDTFKMCRQALPTRLTRLTRPRYSDRSPPLVEDIEDIVLAEFNRYGA